MESEHPDKAAVLFHPPVLLLLFIGLGFAGRWLISAEFLPHAWALPIGLTTVVVSLVLFAWAVITMLGDFWGIFAITRFGWEFLRDPAAGGARSILSTSQWMCLLMLGVAVALVFSRALAIRKAVVPGP